MTTTPDPKISAVGASLIGQVRLLLAIELDEEEAAMRLAVVAEPSRLHFLALEARRRAELVSWVVQTTPWSGPGMSSLAAGYRSVADDVAAGRLR